VGTADRAVNSTLTRKRWLLAFAVGAGLVAVIAATRPGPWPNHKPNPLSAPTEAEAQQILTATYETAKRSPDGPAFCARSQAQAICLAQYNDRGGRDGVPTTPPALVHSRVLGRSRVLTVCGVDGQGHSYRADFPVERSANGSLLVGLEVFWDSKTYSGNRADGEPVQVTPGPQKFSC